jgi:hypothetical protein
MKKKVLIAIGMILAIYISFVTIDCVRLGNTNSETKPIITVSLAEDENRSKYMGLGYSVTYYKDRQDNIDENIDKNVYGAEFRLFDTILIWAWVE